MPRIIDTKRAAAYAVLIPAISRTAREFGYAACIHGSMSSDLDLVLVPWTEDAAKGESVVEAIRLLLGGRYKERLHEPYAKPHGRLSWTVWLTPEGAEGYDSVEPYLDISVMPRRADEGTDAA